MFIMACIVDMPIFVTIEGQVGWEKKQTLLKSRHYLKDSGNIQGFANSHMHSGKLRDLAKSRDIVLNTGNYFLFYL